MSTMLSNLDLLRRVPLFSLLTMPQAEVISGAVVKKRFKRGEALVEQGQRSTTLFILLTGRARVSGRRCRQPHARLAVEHVGDIIPGEVALGEVKARGHRQ